jgi:antitoxin VapB
MNETPRIPKPAAVGKLFKNGLSQAVRIPAEFRFEGTEVEFRAGPNPGEVILAPIYRRTGNWDRFREAVSKLKPEDIPEGFPWRDRRPHDRDPFA